MDKPLSLTIREARNNIISAINEQGLPPSILLLIMKDIMTEVTNIESTTYHNELSEYKEKLKSAEKQENEDGNDTDTRKAI